MEIPVKLVSARAQSNDLLDFAVQAEGYKLCVETEPDLIAESLLEVRGLVPPDLIADSKIPEFA